MMRHIVGPILYMSEQYRRERPIKPDVIVSVDRKTWVTHYDGHGALAKRIGSGTRWAVRQTDRPPKLIRG